MPGCIAILKTGDRSGERCTHAAKEGSDKCGTHRNWVAPPPRCIGVTKAATQCTHNAESAAVPTCARHRGTARTIDAIGVDVIVPQACSRAGCRRPVIDANAQNECGYHVGVRAHRERHQERVALFRRIHDAYRAVRGGPPITMNTPAIMREMQRVTMRVFHHLIDFGVEQSEENIRVVAAIFPMRPDAEVIEEDRERHELWNRLIGGGGGGAGGGALPNTLAGIAASRQSVHASEVVQQAARGMDFLLKVKIPSGWDDESKVLDELKTLWSGEEHDDTLHADIRTWWNQKSCFNTDDYMYRKLLTGLWTYVKTEEDAERRKELEKRMFQECSEAVRMCCQGHTNRLVNVLGGFVSGVDVVVQRPKGEVLQEQFALIGAMEDVAERTRRANEIIAELGLTADEAAPWLEAIE